MKLRDAISALGGPSAVGSALDERPKAVGMWGSRGRVPQDQLLPFWRLCLDAGIAWEPPGADAIRAQLAAPAKQEAA